MDSKRIRIALIERGERLVDLHRVTGISYNRLVRLVNGYCEPRREETQVIAAALDLGPQQIGSGEPAFRRGRKL